MHGWHAGTLAGFRIQSPGHCLSSIWSRCPPALASSCAFTHCSHRFLTDGSFFASQDPIWWFTLICSGLKYAHDRQHSLLKQHFCKEKVKQTHATEAVFHFVHPINQNICQQQLKCSFPGNKHYREEQIKFHLFCQKPRARAPYYFVDNLWGVS